MSRTCLCNKSAHFVTKSPKVANVGASIRKVACSHWVRRCMSNLLTIMSSVVESSKICNELGEWRLVTIAEWHFIATLYNSVVLLNSIFGTFLNLDTSCCDGFLEVDIVY